MNSLSSINTYNPEEENYKKPNCQYPWIFYRQRCSLCIQTGQRTRRVKGKKILYTCNKKKIAWWKQVVSSSRWQRAFIFYIPVRKFSFSPQHYGIESRRESFCWYKYKNKCGSALVKMVYRQVQRKVYNIYLYVLGI